MLSNENDDNLMMIIIQIMCWELIYIFDDNLLMINRNTNKQTKKPAQYNDSFNQNRIQG